MILWWCFYAGVVVFLKRSFYRRRRRVMRAARFQLGWKVAHAEPWGAVHSCGVVLASGRRSDIVSDVVPNNFCPSELADTQLLET